MIEAYLPYLIGALTLWAAQAVAARLGIKLPVPPMPPMPGPGPAQPGPALPSLPMPDGKGTFLLALLQLFLKARQAPQSLTPEERQVANLAWNALPDDEPKP